MEHVLSREPWLLSPAKCPTQTCTMKLHGRLSLLRTQVLKVEYKYTNSSLALFVSYTMHHVARMGNSVDYFSLVLYSLMTLRLF